MHTMNASRFSRKKTPQNILRGFYCAFILIIYTVRKPYAILFTARVMRETFLAEVFL